MNRRLGFFCVRRTQSVSPAFKMHRISGLLAILGTLMLFAPVAHTAPSKAPTDYIQPSLKGDSFSKSPLGYASLRRFLENIGHKPIIVRDPRERSFTAQDVILMLDPNLHHTMTPAQVNALQSYVTSDATLVVSLPKRYAAQQSLAGQELLQTGMLSLGASAGILRILDGYGNIQRDVYPEQRGAWDLDIDVSTLQSFHELPDGWEILVGDPRAAVLIRGTRRNGAPIYYLSDADLLSNHALGQADHALIFQRLVDTALEDHGSLYMDEAFHGYLQVYSAFQTGLRGKGVWLTVTTALFALLLLWFYLGSVKRRFRDLRVVPYREQDLAQRTGDILGNYRKPKERLQRFRDILVRDVLSTPFSTDDPLDLARLEQLERLRNPRLSLHALDQKLHALSPNATRRQMRQLLREYQQWFAEVNDATR